LMIRLMILIRSVAKIDKTVLETPDGHLHK